MKLPAKHQEILDAHLETHPDFQVSLQGKEENCFHVMFIDIVKDGKWSRGVPVFQKYFKKEWLQMLKTIENPVFGMIVTGHDEYSIVYDPDVAAAEREAKAKAAAKVKAMNDARKQKAAAKKEVKSDASPQNE